MNKFLILGATSAVARSFCERVISKGSQLVLVGRSEDKINSLKNHYNTIKPGSVIHTFILDFNHTDNHHELATILKSCKITNVLCAWGILGNDKRAQVESSHALEIINSNFTSYVSVLATLTPYFEKLKKGSIIVITSVAGDRGRQSNYTYGSAKGALSIYLDGMRHRFANSKVSIIDIKPGFIDTPMTANFKKGLLWAKPETIAKDIDNAIIKSLPKIYTPFFWRYIMYIIKNIPFKVFRKLNI
mgnify:CR=1 FL=1